MKRKLFVFSWLCSLLVIHCLDTQAQCPVGRYLYPSFFTSYTVTTDTYSTANSYTALVDIYQPVGDTLSARPLIILAHGGSFIGGTRNDDSTVVWLCRNFALRGYVTASIEYRLSNLSSMLDSLNAIDEVMKSVSDGKAAIRYFVKDRATSNTYKIDTNNIFIGGNSAGAVLYMQAGYIDSIGECPADIQTAMLANGGFEGNSGNAGYTTRFKAIINLAGALNEVSMAGPGDKPSVNAQGDGDSTVPYYCGDPYIVIFYLHPQLCGLGSLEPQYNAVGIPHMSHVFPGQGHIPWSTNPPMFVTVDSLIQVFLYDQVCIPLSVTNFKATPEISLFPNPANSFVSIHSTREISEFAICDELGRNVFSEGDLSVTDYTINTSGFSKGIYFIKLKFYGQDNEPVVKKILVE